MIELMPVAVLQNRITQASTNGIMYLRLQTESAICLPDAIFALWLVRRSSISSISMAACSGVRERRRAAWARCSLAVVEEPARRFGNEEAARYKESARRKRYPENTPPCLVFEGEKSCCAGGFGNRFDAVTVVDPDQSRGHDAQRQQPLEDGRAFTAARGREALGEVKRDGHADQSGADALQKAAKKSGE